MNVDLTPILVPIVVSVVLSIGGAFVVARYSGPAQSAYIQALQGRLAVVEQERDDAELAIPKLEARIDALETHVSELQRTIHERDKELLSLYRRLEADERRLP
jgi:chromosome segregation ATPase